MIRINHRKISTYMYTRIPAVQYIVHCSIITCFTSLSCFTDIMNRKPQLAWELYLKMETSADSFSLLQVLANDCYKMGQFYYSAKAFDVLERLDPSPEYWEGKRGACVGLLQMVIAGHEPRESLKDIVQILRSTSQPQAELIVMAIRKWARENRIPVPGL